MSRLTAAHRQQTHSVRTTPATEHRAAGSQAEAAVLCVFVGRGVGRETKMAAVAQAEHGSILLYSLGCAFRDVLMKDLVGDKDE